MRSFAQVGGYLGEENTAYLQRIDQRRWEQYSILSPSFRARVRMSRMLTVAVSQGKVESKGEQNALVGDEATMLFNMMQNGDGYKKVVKNNLVSRVAWLGENGEHRIVDEVRDEICNVCMIYNILYNIVYFIYYIFIIIIHMTYLL
jgi:hypothetical protein